LTGLAGGRTVYPAVRLGEIAMARGSLLSMVRGPVLAVVLVSAAGCGGGAVDEASGTGAVAAEPAEEGVPPGSDAAEDSDDGSTDDGSDDSDDSGDSGDSGDTDEGSAGGPDVDAEGAGARPGGPFDIEAFEQVGTSYAEFLESAPGPCDGVQCTLSYEFVEDAERTSGCWVNDFVNDPPARPEGASRSDQFIQRGTAVTAVIGCAPGVDPEDVDTLEEAFGESTTEELPPTDEATATEESPPTEEASTTAETPPTDEESVTDVESTDGSTAEETGTDEGTG
jgi:hypothetical protein